MCGSEQRQNDELDTARREFLEATGQAAPQDPMFSDPDDLVEPGDGCPRCGELHVHQLILQPDKRSIRCASCGWVHRFGQ